ncbi:MAG: type I 3-dehydroquinate dehydratase [Thermodesulfovibrionales bacterium]|nr:type I 3-dehydroquinate dehydratase [Thermodesulfovibrionales bacterium]
MIEVKKTETLFSEKTFIAGVVTAPEVLEHSLIKYADMLELRIDSFERNLLDNLEEIVQRARVLDKILIATIRSQKEGGKRYIDDDTRCRLFRKIIPYVDIFDIELYSDLLLERMIPLIREKDKYLLVSYHNFEETPKDSVIEEIFLRAKKRGADIVKIAVTANSREDLIRMAQFTIRHRRDRIVTISMGEHGRPSRLLFPVLGSIITYAGITELSAPGQPKLGDPIFSILREWLK